VCKVVARVKLFLVYHHTSSLLCGKILTTPTFLLLENGFFTEPHLEAENAKCGYLTAIVFNRTTFFQC